MVQHIVMWTFREEVDKEATVKELQRIFAPLPGEIPGLIEIAVYGGFHGYDACLISKHEDAAAIQAYQNHPAHLACKGFVHSVKDKRASCDFVLE